MPDAYAQMLANPNLSDEQRAKILKMQERRRQREQSAAAAAPSAGTAASAAGAAPRPPHAAPQQRRVLVSFLQPCWLTPWNLVTKMLAKQLSEPLALSVQCDATVGELQALIERATGVLAARQRLYATKPGSAVPTGSDGDGDSAGRGVAADMRLVPTSDSEARSVALQDCGLWPAAQSEAAAVAAVDGDQQAGPPVTMLDQEAAAATVWVAAIPDAAFPVAKTSAVGSADVTSQQQQQQQQAELQEQVRCQLVASGGLQLSYDTDLFTRPMHHAPSQPVRDRTAAAASTIAAVRPEPEPEQAAGGGTSTE